MEYRIYRYIFMLSWTVFYFTFAFTIAAIPFGLLHRPIPDALNGIIGIGVLILSGFQATQTVEIYFATDRKFLQSMYLSLIEFWGLLVMLLQGKHRRVVPKDKFEIDEKTIHDRKPQNS